MSKATAMTTQVEMVGPALAEAWLNNNYENNRILRWSHVLTMAEYIKTGDWKITHQGIGFDEDGKLIDGQHRLWAIIESGKTVPVNVSRNVPRDAFGVLDQGKNRSVADLSGDKTMSPRIVSIAKAMARGTMQAHPGEMDDRNPSVLLRFIAQHRDEISRVMAIMPDNTRARGRKNVTAVGTAVLVRASNHVALEVLGRFLQVLMSGEIANQGERGALLLRDWIATHGQRRDRTVEYQKTQRALKAFVDSDPIDRLFGIQDDLYPLSDVAPRKTLAKGSKTKSHRGTEQRRRKAVKGL